jgi:hypothetical protein
MQQNLSCMQNLLCNSDGPPAVYGTRYVSSSTNPGCKRTSHVCSITCCEILTTYLLCTGPGMCRRHGACLRDGGGGLHTCGFQLLPCFHRSPSPLAAATATAAATPDAGKEPYAAEAGVLCLLRISFAATDKRALASSCKLKPARAGPAEFKGSNRQQDTCRCYSRCCGPPLLNQPYESSSIR